MMFRERLDRLARRVGASTLTLVGADGIPVESVADCGGTTVEMLSAECVALVRSMGQNQRELLLGDLRGVSVVTDSHVIAVFEVGPDFFLLAVCDEPSSLGRLRFELRRSPLVFAEDLV